jgi:hypothetical protein
MARYLVLGLIGWGLLGCNGTIGEIESGVARAGDPQDTSAVEPAFDDSRPGGGTAYEDDIFPPANEEPSLPPQDIGTLPEASPPPIVAPTPVPEEDPTPPGEVVTPPVEVVPPDDLLGISEADFNSIPAELLIKASRDSCTSPCAVFFDAIGDVSWDEITTSRFTWAFSDGTTADGFMAARVFELPEGEPEATFEATLVIEQDGFLVARDTHMVTVQPSEGRTICVSQGDFSGCPSSNSADHFTNAGDAWNAIETNGRVLFRRGDSFPGMNLSATVSGPVQVGAFGDPGAARPSLQQSGGALDLDSGWSFTDVDISGGGMSGSLVNIQGEHTLMLRSHIRDAEKAFVSNGDGYGFSTHKFLFYNLVTNIESTTYIGGDYIAIVGNHMERWGADHHNIRIAGGNHSLLVGNSLVSDKGFSSLTVRGSGSGNRPGSNYVLVQGNLMTQTTSVNPQNASSEEYLRHVIWERNLHAPHQSLTSIRSGMDINAQDMVIRNNVFHQIRRAINIYTHPLTGASRNIHVYQNTQYVDEDLSSTHRFCDASSSGSGIVVEDNLAVLYSDADSTTFVTGNASLGSNYAYTPSRTGECERPDGSATCTDPNLANTSDLNSPSFMMPQAGSLALDAATDATISNDFYGTPRPQGGAPDIGAVERP